jgi:hypothetical protein
MTQPFWSLRDVAGSLRARCATLRARAVPLRERVDPALFAVVAVAALAFGAGGWTFARIEDARGFLDPQAVEEINDPRILSDYRSFTAPIVDMVPLGFQAYVGRADGTVHRHDMRTGLFAEESLPRAPALAGTLAFLSSTCTDTAVCAAGATVFAVTETGGLAARGSGGWRTVISDSAWLGRDGLPVDLPEVSLWALSDDGRWLLASAGKNGLGLFDQTRSIWVPVAQGGAVSDPAHLNFAHGRFWLGGSGGLETIDPGRPDVRATVPGVGAVLDLERAADGNLLALQSTSCTGGTCLSINEARSPTDLRRLVGETEISPSLSAAALSHAALQDGRVVVLGAAGVHVYDLRSRSWTVLEAGPVDAFHAGTEGRSLLFAAGTAIGRVVGGQIVWQAEVPDKVKQILPGPGNAVLALLRNGSVVDLAQPGPAVVVPADLGPGDPARITAGATVGGTVVLRRGADLILHDPAARRWSVAQEQVPPSAGAGARLLGTASALWLVDEATGRVWEGVVDGAWPQRSVSFTEAAPALGPLNSVQADGNDLHLVTASGDPQRLRAGGGALEARVGDPAPRGFRPVTGAAAAGAMLFSDGTGIAAYDTTKRNWTEVWQGPPGGVRDIDVVPGSVLALARDGVLYSVQDSGWTTLSGASEGIALGSDQMSDALQAGSSIFLGGAGQVVEYRPDMRRAIGSFGTGTGDVRLVGAPAGDPLWTSNGRLFLGEQQVSENSERVVWAGRGPDGFLYVAETNGRRHLVSMGPTRQCLFRGGSAPGGTPVDARGLPDGRVFVATTDALAIHEPENRRWVRLEGGGVASSARIEIVAGHLVLIEGTAARAVPLSALPRPDSCDAGVANAPWAPLPPALQVVHDAAADRLLIMGRDGALQEWRGALRQMLPPAGTAPAMADLRRVRAVPDGLIFAAADRLWTYDGQDRTWSSRAIEGGPATVAAMDLQTDGAITNITIWDEAGQGYGGEALAGPITLRHLLGPLMPRPGQDPARIRDMVQGDGYVAILGERVLELFDKGDFRARATMRLPNAVRGWELAQVAGTGALVLSDGPADAPERLFVLGFTATNTGTADLAQVSFAYAPGDDRDWQISGDALWRIDRALILHRCEVANGQTAPTGCQPVTGAPEPMDPGNLIAAATLPGGDVLVATEEGVLRIDNTRRVSGRTSVPGTNATSRFVAARGAVYLWTGQGGDLWRFTDSDAPDRLLGGVLDLRESRDGIAAITANGLILLAEGGVPQTLRAGDLPLRAATVGLDGSIHGIGPDGQLRRHGPSDAVLSEVVLLDDVLAVAQGPTPDGVELASPGAVWAQHGDGQMRIHWVGLCQPPDPTIDPADGAPNLKMDASEATEGDLSVPETAAPKEEAAIDETGTTESASAAILETPLGDAEPASVSANPDASAAKTSEVEPNSVPEPAPLPCPKVLDTGLSLAADERLLQVNEHLGGATVLTTRASHTMTAVMLHEARQSDWSPAIPANTHVLDTIRGDISDIDGRPYLAPPRLGGMGGRLTVNRGAGGAQSFAGGRPGPIAAFDLGWLAWDRATGTVQFGDAPGLPPEQAIQDGRFLPDIPGRTAYLGGDAFALLNPHGQWRVRIRAEVLPLRIALSDLPQDLAGGRFLFARDGVDARTGASVSDTGQETVALGALRVIETLRGGRLQATYSVGAQDVPAMAARGFELDQREGVTAESGDAWLLTPLGLVSAGGLGAGIALPAGATSVDTEGSAALARGPGGWSRRTAQGWMPSARPWHDRLLAEGNGRRWERRSGMIEIVPMTPDDAHTAARQGLDFDGERLLALAGDKRRLVALTGTGTHEAASLSALASLPPPIAPDPGAASLDAREVVPGQSVLWAETAQGRRVWDSGARAWRTAAPGEDPWTFRLAVDSGDLRLAFRQGRAEPSVRIEDIGGGQRHVGFAWEARQNMPFDRVRGFSVEGDRILLATDIGLRRLVWSGQGAVAGDLYSGVAPGTPPLAFDRVGRPAADSARLLATAGAACFDLSSPDGTLAPCGTPGNLTERAVPSDPLWRWHKTDTEIAGNYLDHLEQTIEPVRLGADGYWSHDRLRRVAGCTGAVAELWANADIVASAPIGLPGHLQALPGVEEFLCQSGRVELGQGALLAPGFVAAGPGGAWRLVGQSWQPENEAEAIMQRARRDVPWEAARLRLRLDGTGAVLELRGLDDVWREVPWDADRPAVDRVAGIAGTGATLQLMTPVGVLDWSFSDRRLDPETVILRTPVDRGAFSECGPVRIEARDGSVQAVQRVVGDPVDILCEDGRVWRGDPSAAADAGVFAPALSDIGADRVQVQNDDWVWTRRVAAGGAEALSIAFRDEAVSLDTGRLSLDDYSGLAAPYTDHVEIVTQGAGWWRSPRRDLSLTAVRRPPPGAGAETVVSLHSDLLGGTPHLCVQGENAVIVDPSGGVARAAGCRDVRGTDATYTWHTGPGGATAEGVALNDLPLQRNLAGGRFGDLFVTGAPLYDGRGRILAPTRAGVVVIGPQGPEGTYASTDPGFLASDITGNPVALGPSGAMPLTGGDVAVCSALADLSARLPEDARVLRVHRLASDGVEALVAMSDGDHLPLLVPCGSLQDALAWTLPLDVMERARYRAIGADVLSPSILAWLDGSRLTVAEPRGRSFRLDDRIAGQPVAQVAAPDGRSVVVATDHALYRVDIDRVLGLVGSGQADAEMSTPSGPFAPANPPVEPDAPKPVPATEPTAAMLPSPKPARVSENSTIEATGSAQLLVLDDMQPLDLNPAGWREIQQSLQDLGLYTGAIDGIAGPMTQAALRKWQTQTGRVVTGEVTERQRADLLGETR